MKARLRLILLVGFFTLLVLDFQNCAKNTFSKDASLNTAAGLQPTSGLSANDLTFATNVNVQLTIQFSDILAGNSAPRGQSLSIRSVGSPTLGQLTQSGTHYNFVSSTTGNSQFSYTISDSAGEVSTATITVKVLGSTAATGSFYACNLSGDLYVLDPFQGSLQNLVMLTTGGNSLGLNDLAMDSSANLYGKDPHNNIYLVNVTTGVSQLTINNLIPASYFAGGLTILPSGNFVTTKNITSKAPSSVVSVNPTTLAETIIVPESAGYSMSTGSQIEGDIKYLPDGYLYWTVVNSSTKLCANYAGPGNQTILQINPNTGAIKELVCLTKPDITGLGYANGKLYGFSEGGNLIQIDIATGSISLINATGDTFIGATSNPALW